MVREVRRWGARPIACYESTSTWSERASSSLGLLRVGVKDLVILVATHATAALPTFKEMVRGIDASDLMVVADEGWLRHLHRTERDPGLVRRDGQAHR